MLNGLQIHSFVNLRGSAETVVPRKRRTAMTDFIVQFSLQQDFRLMQIKTELRVHYFSLSNEGSYYVAS